MRKNISLYLLLAGCSSMLLACGTSSSDNKSAVVPNMGKADVADEVNILGNIEFGDTRTGTFHDDFQFDAFTFYSPSYSTITIGTDASGAKVDSTLFLYGPANETGRYPSQPIAMNDDYEANIHARIDHHYLNIGGDFLVVIGTSNARGRGAYSVRLECVEGTCLGYEEAIHYEPYDPEGGCTDPDGGCYTPQDACGGADAGCSDPDGGYFPDGGHSPDGGYVPDGGQPKDGGKE